MHYINIWILNIHQNTGNQIFDAQKNEIIIKLNKKTCPLFSLEQRLHEKHENNKLCSHYGRSADATMIVRLLSSHIIKHYHRERAYNMSAQKTEAERMNTLPVIVFILDRFKEQTRLFFNLRVKMLTQNILKTKDKISGSHFCRPPSSEDYTALYLEVSRPEVSSHSSSKQTPREQ